MIIINNNTEMSYYYELTRTLKAKLSINKKTQYKIAKLFLQFVSIFFFNFIGEKSDLLSKSNRHKTFKLKSSNYILLIL